MSTPAAAVVEEAHRVSGRAGLARSARDWPRARGEGDVIGLDRIAAVTGADWGWFTTASDTLDRLAEASGDFDAERSTRLRSRIGEIRAAIAAAPKSLRWRARARIGRRMPWYEIPEEHVR
jgi:hypothetical protein